MDPQLLGTLFSGALGGAFTSKVLAGPIKTLDDWWYVNFGYKQSEKVDMLRARQAKNLEAYNILITEKISSKPEEHIQEPKLSILGPALEASRFYIEEENLREMFASLIASSMDCRMNSYVHTSFVEVIKQMSPYDGTLLKDFKHSESLPIGQITVEKKKKRLVGKTMMFDVSPEVFIIEDDYYISANCPDHIANELALSSLKRLGLIEIQDRRFSDKDQYTKLKEAYNNYILLPNNANFPNDDEEYNLHLNMVSLTKYGQSFITSCV